MTTKNKATKIALQPRCILIVLLVCLLIFGSSFILKFRKPFFDCEASRVFRLPLFVYDLDLLVNHLPSKPVDRNMDPVMLFPFRDEIILEALRIWLIVTRLGYYIDQYVPNARLRDRTHRSWNNFPPSLNSLIVV